MDVFLTAPELATRVAAMGEQIASDYEGGTVLVVCVLKGSFVFAADLLRAIPGDAQVDFLGTRSYGAGTKSSGVVQITHDISRSIEGEDVLLVEDIVDTGLTLSHLLDLLRTRRPKSLRVCALLHKPSRMRVKIPIDYLGFTIDDKFVVGYGLDHAERYRNLPYLATLDPHEVLSR